MTKKKPGHIVLPALRGVMSGRVYYTCLMDLNELSRRVHYAYEVHKNKSLSDMIQRELKKGRGIEIAQYLKDQPEAFFNSLVIGTYNGQPNWHALSDLRSKSKSEEFQNLSEEIVESVGFLSLRGDEELFAIDGQHRLAGIKKAIKDKLVKEPYDEVSVVFVGHKLTKKGIESTRRLFTTLNKTARPVSKGNIIALDEDDVMALTVRWLIEETELFSGERIAFVPSNNMPVSNTTSLTTIGNLYDILVILFTKVQSKLMKSIDKFTRVRPTDKELDEYFKYAKSFFIQLRTNFEELENFFSSKTTESVVKKFRGSHGGNALFRPIGLEIFAKIIARLSKDMPISSAVKQAAILPRDLNEPPFEGLMWDSSNETISNSHKVTLREILLYMLDKSKFSEATLLEKYRKATGNETAQLPSKVI